MSFGEGDLHERVEQLEKERDYWKRECADMLSEFWDTESGHCAMLDYPRPASEPAPSIIVMASRMGNDEYREWAENRISELESLVMDMYECGKHECNESCPHRKTGTKQFCEFGSAGWLTERMTALGLEAKY